MWKKYCLYLSVIITLKLLFFYTHFHILKNNTWQSSFGLTPLYHFFVEFLIYNIIFLVVIKLINKPK